MRQRARTAMLAGFRARQTRSGVRAGRAQRGGFHAIPARTGICACRAERGALCTFHGHAHWFCLHSSTVIGMGRYRGGFGEAGRGVWGETWNRAVFSRGRGGFRVSPQCFYQSFLLQFVRSAVVVILTSPSCLVEGVRPGSRRRNGPDTLPQAGGGVGPESRHRKAARPDCLYARHLRVLYGWRIGSSGLFVDSSLVNI